MAMTITAAKHMNMLDSSRGMIGSLSRQYATIEIQKGLVYQNTMIKARGAKGAATFKRIKFAYPVTIRTRRVNFC